ncbi:MAG: 3-oxoacyl-ACP synthase III [Gammaproteobacteria bacterium]|jgi:3-oxoacyl-[acyl-carrier-protein] synthase-3|nr:3-oxoacyl-ACP synthase III [Gammaproteobacteria bacterium]
MNFKNVVVQSVAAVEPPISLSSKEISQRLKPTMQRLGVREDLLEEISGIKSRKLWEEGARVSDAATLAAEKAIEESGVERSRIGLLISTSVSRDFLEPSTACVVHADLGLAPDCLNFDVANACLGFLNAMDIAAGMLERGELDYALIVDGESSRQLIDATCERLLDPAVDQAQFRAEFASLTLGSGAAAMVMSRGDLETEGHRYRGSVTRAATGFNKLCQGDMERMFTDTRSLMSAGLELATKTFGAARESLGWVETDMDQFVIHQVSKVHTESLVKVLGLDPEKVHVIYPEMGNVGPASAPIALARVAAAGKLEKGDRVALLGIGSGLNCSMSEIVW